MALPTWLYVLRLEGGYFYVGTTSDLSGRLAAHWAGAATAWTTQHRPSASTVKRCSSAVEEDATVKHLMLKHGVARVRGGSYSAPRLDEASLRALELEMRHARGVCFGCGGEDHWVADCPERAAGAAKKTRTRPPTCDRCGRDTHRAEECYARTHLDGHALPPVARLLPVAQPSPVAAQLPPAAAQLSPVAAQPPFAVLVQSPPAALAQPPLHRSAARPPGQHHPAAWPPDQASDRGRPSPCAQQ